MYITGLQLKGLILYCHRCPLDQAYKYTSTDYSDGTTDYSNCTSVCFLHLYHGNVILAGRNNGYTCRIFSNHIKTVVDFIHNGIITNSYLVYVKRVHICI